jgi:hypothetical protein
MTTVVCTEEARKMTYAQAQSHRVLYVQSPWAANLKFMIDREAKLKSECRVVLEMENYDGSASYLPGRLDTKHPDQAKSLTIILLGPGDQVMGPVRRCQHKRLLRIVGRVQDLL